MKEIKCPKCGTVISIDEADFAAILSQVRNDEFEAEIGRRMSDYDTRKRAEEAQKAAEDRAQHQGELGKKQAEIDALKLKLEGYDEVKRVEMDKYRLETDNASKDALGKKDNEIAELKKEIEGLKQAQKLEIENSLLKAKQASDRALGEKQNELVSLQSELASEKQKALEKENVLKEQFKGEKERLEKEVEMYKDFKAKRSVKLIGEDLEQHCNTLYNQMLRPVMPNATFVKDNDAVREEGETKGTKGDFIFRDSEDGIEYLSIMFEMKNEGDESANRKKNDSFFEKLDKDRKKKGCEFAVLVSMLELDNEMYNNGIVVAPGYDKMYVIRPDNFIPLITLLVQMSRRSLETRKALEIAQQQSMDVTNFEKNVNEVKRIFNQHAKNAHDRYDEAINGIQSTIEKLQAIKAALETSSTHLINAGNKLEDLSIKKLTRNNPTMKALFEQARAAGGASEEEGPEEQ